MAKMVKESSLANIPHFLRLLKRSEVFVYNTLYQLTYCPPNREEKSWKMPFFNEK